MLKIKFATFLATAAISIATPASAASILFTFVQDDGSYVSNGQELAGYLGALPGISVTQRILDNAIYDDYDTFDQIWVYDLEVGANNNATQAANYTAIADWFNNRTDQNLIVDGRIISSTSNWTNANTMSSEAAWIQNYALQLDSRGGGLVLGTDQAVLGQSSGAFVDGINQINAQIGIDPFSGLFGSFPTSQAAVDPLSPLFVSGLDTCRTSADSCINDNSTSSFAPAGAQPGGLFLTPVAYHGNVSSAFDNAAVASTFTSRTFTVPEPSTLLGIMTVVGMGLLSQKTKGLPKNGTGK